MVVLCSRGLCTLWVRASLPLVAGLLCYHGLVLWCVGLQLCHWSLRSARAWVLGAAPGLCPPLGHTVRPRRVGLRPLLPWPRRAARLVVGGARRSVWRATRRAAFCRHTGFVDCGWVFFRRQTRVSRPVCTAFGPALRPPYEQPFALAHCESCTAPRGVAVELKASPHDSASISRCSKAAAVHESGRALVAEVQSCSKRQPPQCCHAKRDSCAVSASVGGVGRHLGSRHKCAPP